jgi:hypothetical protein
MRVYIIPAALIAASVAVPARAATIIVYQNPMTMDRKVVVRESAGPNRAFLCVLPPSDLGCHEVQLKRG